MLFPYTSPGLFPQPTNCITVSLISVAQPLAGLCSRMSLLYNHLQNMSMPVSAVRCFCRSPQSSLALAGGKGCFCDCVCQVMRPRTRFSACCRGPSFKKSLTKRLFLLQVLLKPRRSCVHSNIEFLDLPGFVRQNEFCPWPRHLEKHRRVHLQPMHKE